MIVTEMNQPWFRIITPYSSYLGCMFNMFDHRVITVIEEQRPVVLGRTTLFTKVGQLHNHITYDREEEWENFIFGQTE